MTVKTIKELEEMRKERNINKSTMGVCAGGTHRTWGQAVQTGYASERLKANAVTVLKFYDENGIVPVLGDVELEPLGREAKS